MECPDNSSICPTGNSTCCYSNDYPGVYGCCEGRNAVCCNDMHHCCPDNHVCDSHKGICTQTISTSQLKSTETTAIHSPNVVVCPDGKTRCPNKTTCCLLITGSFGCCEYPGAKCCEDKIHCCPHGHDCDPNSDKCTRRKSFSPLLVLLPQMSKLCPDYITICTSNETCCKLSNNSWACCPAPDAVCCGSYCCPKGKVCDLNEDCKTKLNSPSKKMQLVEVIQHSKVLLSMKQDIRDRENSYDCKNKCSFDQTCCGLGLDEYGCCPEREAMCCSDGQHCCSDGYKCLPNGKCIKT